MKNGEIQIGVKLYTHKGGLDTLPTVWGQINPYAWRYRKALTVISRNVSNKRENMKVYEPEVQ